MTANCGESTTTGKRLAAMGYHFIAARDLPDGRTAWIARFMFTHAIIVGSLDSAGYDDRWCYATSHAAKRALAAWKPESELEPYGWHRHPASGRRRPNGDAKNEYIQP